MQFGRVTHGAVVVNGSLWVMGGLCPTPNTPFIPVATCEVFDAEFGFWNPKVIPDLPTLSSDAVGPGMGYITALHSPVDDRVYLIGGASSGNEGLDAGCDGYSLAISASSPSTSVWETVPSWAPPGTVPDTIGCYTGSSAALSGSTIFVASEMDNTQTIVAALSVLNWGAGWTYLAQPNIPRSGTTLVASAGFLWLLGGAMINPGPAGPRRAVAASRALQTPTGLPISEVIPLANLSAAWQMYHSMPGTSYESYAILLAPAKNATLVPTPFAVISQEAFEWVPASNFTEL